MQTFAATDADAYKSLARAWAASVTVVTARRAQGPFTVEKPELDGFTATAFLTVSINPPIILVSIAKASGADELLGDVEHFTVNLLARDQGPLAQAFARTQSERGQVFSQFAWKPDERGVPVLEGALGAFSARVQERKEAGDHWLILGAVEALHHASSQDTLVYHNRGFGQVHRHE